MFWENYLQLCNKVGKSANAVAAEIGFKSSGTVTGWKDGKIPYERNLKKIADYFGVTVDDLIGDDSAQKEKPTAQGDGLTEKQKYAIELIKSTSDDDLDKLIDMFKIWAGGK